eukprot:gene22231-29298_t
MCTALPTQRGGALVIRRLCGHMGPGRVFSELSLILHEESDLSFASTIVQALNLILLTSPDVRELREMLRRRCYRSSRCCFLHLPLPMLVGAEVLVQVDRLVQLLETPCYTFLRLQLLHPRKHPALLRAMYSLLMLLPQSNAFRTLNNRLQSIPTLAMMQLDPTGTSSSGYGLAVQSDSDGDAVPGTSNPALASMQLDPTGASRPTQAMMQLDPTGASRPTQAMMQLDPTGASRPTQAMMQLDPTGASRPTQAMVQLDPTGASRPTQAMMQLDPTGASRPTQAMMQLDPTGASSAGYG